MANAQDFENLRVHQQAIQDTHDQLVAEIVRRNAGTRDDPESFDATGKPSTDPTHGLLGYYPVHNLSGQIVYEPCPDRIAYFAETASGPGSEPGPDTLQAFGIVNMGQQVGRLSGGTNFFLLTQVIDGASPYTFANQVSVTIGGDSNGSALLICDVVDSGLKVTLGAANAPEPQPDYSPDPLDLGGPSIVYCNLSSAAALNIRTNHAAETFNITLESGLSPIAIRETIPVYTPTNTYYDIGLPGNPSEPHDHPWQSHGPGSTTTSFLTFFDARVAYGVSGIPDPVWDDDNGAVTINRYEGFSSDAVGLIFPDLADAAKTRCPHRFRVDVTATLPADDFFLAEFGTFGVGGLSFTAKGDGHLSTTMYRNGASRLVQSTVYTRPFTGLHKYSVEWVDDPAGDGGTVNFYIDDTPFGDPVPFEIKLRIDSSAKVYINNSYGNVSVARDGYYFKKLLLDFDDYSESYVFHPITSGTISRTDLESLWVDGTAVTTQQPEKTLSYSVSGGPATELTIVVGEMLLPAGRAKYAVLEDWSDGTGVPHDNVLVLTRPIAQNCRFQDANYFAAQPPWGEFMSQGPVPEIAGIQYFARCLRIGNYVQIQFGYEWTAETMASAPFGDPAGLVTYMVPHKWMIYDSEGTLLHRIEKPNGSPLNAADAPNVFEGPWDYSGAKIDAAHPYYPIGTVRMGIIWASHDLEDHDDDLVNATFFRHATDAPYSLHTTYSNNGLNLLLYGGNVGSSGQMNGYSNWLSLPWQQTDWSAWVAEAGVTNDPYTGNYLYSAIGMGISSMSWLKLTPFNYCGRSPTTGPGGGRDDRQIIAEPVCHYIQNPTGGRPRDGLPLRQIAIDYYRSYVSEPYHHLENGIGGPLYKGSPLRPIGLRQHYYGYGFGGPAALAWYAGGGRIYDVQTNVTPLRVPVPAIGWTDRTPYFSLFQIDRYHAHQFPGYGSLLWKSPEFAFLQTSFFDQNRLYQNSILGGLYDAGEWTQRGGAWIFHQCALAWKLGSDTSSRLYSQQEVFDFIVPDFETFHDTHYDADPGFLNPPDNWNSGGDPGYNRFYTAVSKFGAVSEADPGVGMMCQGFMGLYWLGSLAYAHRIGFIDALREQSEKAGTIIDWIISRYRLTVCGILNHNPNPFVYGAPYNIVCWYGGDIAASDGDMTASGSLPQTWAEAAAHNPVGGTGFDFLYEYGNGLDQPPTATTRRAGDEYDLFLSGPSMLKAMGLTGPDLDAAEIVATNFRNNRRAYEEAKGAAAGSEFFTFTKLSFQPVT